MRKHKRGFTLIEVVLFLAVTTALFVGIAAGVQGSIFQQRYNDAVQNYAEFLRSVYSQVSNVQNESTGRSDKAIYGKVVTFREGDENNGESRNVIRSYNLVGDVEWTHMDGSVGSDGTDPTTGQANCANDGSVIERLKCLKANVVMSTTLTPGAPAAFKPVGFVETYKPRWGSEIETANGWDGGKYQRYVGIMIIARSPSSGNISTYVWDNAPAQPGDMSNASKASDITDVIKEIENCTGMSSGSCNTGDPFGTSGGSSTAGSYMVSTNFDSKDIDFCINPQGNEFSYIRRNIRLSEGAHNASGVDVLTEDRVSNSSTWANNKESNRCGE